MSKRGGAVVVGAVAVLMAGAPAPPAQAQESEVHRLRGDRVAVYNLAGRVDVVAGSGDEVVVRVTRRGGDSGLLDVAVGEVGGRQALRVVYPRDEIVYPAEGRGRFETSLRVARDGTFGEGVNLLGRRVRVRSEGRGMEAHADLRIEVPAGRDVEVRLAAGQVEARGVSGDLLVDLSVGGITVAEHRGPLDLDTGSGSVRVADVGGPVRVDTGSGSVRVDRIRGEELRVDTGSGAVRGSGIRSGSVEIDTGSGSIALTGVRAARLRLDTGSGSVELGLLSDVEDLEVDTGSGSVTLFLPADLGAELTVDTGSGGIDVDVPMRTTRMERGRVSGVLGDGRGRIRVDTGSGGVRLRGS